MGFFDKLPSIKDIRDKAAEATEAAKGMLGSGDEPTPESSEQETSDLEQLTAMLNDPQQGAMFEAQLGMDISGAKTNDGVVTKDETVSIVAEFSQKLVDGGYLEDVDTAEKEAHEATVRQELGDDVNSYDRLSDDQKDALLIFIVTPEAQRQEAIQKAVTEGAFSYAPTDDADQDHNVVMVDSVTGEVVDFQRPDIEQTQAYTEVPTVPPHIVADNDIG